MKAAKKAINMTDISKTIAEQTELKPERVMAVFDALVKQKKIKKQNKCAVLDLLMLKLKHKQNKCAVLDLHKLGKCLSVWSHREFEAAHNEMMAAHQAMKGVIVKSGRSFRSQHLNLAEKAQADFYRGGWV